MLLHNSSLCQNEIMIQSSKQPESFPKLPSFQISTTSLFQIHKLHAENIRNCVPAIIKRQLTDFSSSNNSSFSAAKDDSRHEALISNKEIKKLKIANRAETRRPRRNLAIAVCQGLHLESYSNPVNFQSYLYNNPRMQR